MSEMVERVARAIYRGPIPWDALEQGNKNIMLNDAKRAIAAHERALADAGLVIVPREPTAKMAEHGNEASMRKIGEGELRLGTAAITDAWRAMIDEALK